MADGSIDNYGHCGVIFVDQKYILVPMQTKYQQH